MVVVLRKTREDTNSYEDLPICKRLRDRTLIKNNWYEHYAMTTSDFISDVITPTTYEEALKS